LFTLPNQEEEDQIRSSIRTELTYLTSKDFAVSESIIEYFVKKQMTNNYLDLKLSSEQIEEIKEAYEKALNPTTGGARFAKNLGKGIKNRLTPDVVKNIKTFRPNVRIDFENKNTADFKMKLVIGTDSVRFINLKQDNYNELRSLLVKHIQNRYDRSDTKGEIEKYKDKDKDRLSTKKEKQNMNFINSLVIELEKPARDQNKNRNIDNILKELTGENLMVENTGVIKTAKPGERTLNKLCSNFGKGKDYHKDDATISPTDIDAIKNYFHTPIISGMDYHKPSLGKYFIPGAQNPELQKRFIAIFTGDGITQDVELKDLEPITEAYGKIGVIINSRNSDNFIKTKDAEGKIHIKMLSFAGAEINRSKFSAFLKQVVKENKKSYQIKADLQSVQDAVNASMSNLPSAQSDKQVPENYMPSPTITNKENNNTQSSSGRSSWNAANSNREAREKSRELSTSGRSGSVLRQQGYEVNQRNKLNKNLNRKLTESGQGTGGLANIRRESLGEGQSSDSQKQGLNTNPNNVAGEPLSVNNSLFEQGTGPS